MNALISTASNVLQDTRGRVATLILTCIALAIVFSFWDGLGDLWMRWGQQQELSHSYFLPLITLWMLWERRDALTRSVGAPALSGFVVAGAGMFLLFLGALTHIMVAVHLGFVLTLISLPLILGGWSLFAISVVPLAYLFFMVPPPYWVITRMSHSFQLMSSALGVDMIRMFGIPVELSGNVIKLPTETLQVVEACSGLRYLFPFLSLGALAGYFYKGPLWQRVAIFLSTIPITILMNSFRIAVTGVLVDRYGTGHTEGALHFFEGWVVFLMCIAFLMLVIWAFTLLRGQKSPLAFVGFETVPARTPTGTWTQPAFVRNGVILTAVILAMGVFVHAVGNRTILIPEREDFDTLPFEFPEWTSRQATLDVEVATTLGADDYIIADMTGPDGQYVNLYIAYLDAQRDGRSWHSPAQCLPGGGWEPVRHDIEATERLNGERYFRNRMVIEQGDDQMLVYYWYDQRGRKIANEFMMKFALMWDSLVKRRSDGAMIRLMTPVMPGETVGDAEARLNAMQRELEPKLPRYVPN
ncbi:VPLPA-CTERM-specific exosortase XrtD [Parvularcula dongshanensis]|uniref:Exosortase D (VPLPA-CTERM-specific) n=1 Tax=Parvularcula dongshanensis TaxID=1173995 RepID=A0A840I4Z6_9PROT|nr:VPLPA-CTERM-specific exosortase XrtD [Parvularcula dongshanensis]MBB4659909.1 exosortase D (VPLPA-CTERM-specific) [Parvularcula dongshanensis]